MRKLPSILRKELLLLIRDIPGLGILFFMPVLLIFVVTLAQENAVRRTTSVTDILICDQIGDSYSKTLVQSLDSSGFFRPVYAVEGTPVTLPMCREMTAGGKFQFALILIHRDSAVELLADPGSPETNRQAVMNALMFVIKGAQSREAIRDLLVAFPEEVRPVVENLTAEKLRNLPPVRQTLAVRDKAAIQPNVIQNNVPGFILFAMFFIVIPLAGNLITEKNEGSFSRLKTLPVSMASLVTGKVLIYLFVCLVQFLLMIMVGTLVFPAFFDFPPLEFGDQYLAIGVATVAAALAAIGFGVFTGAVAGTHNQAALSGSVMVVLLGLVSGTFFPLHLMPESIRLVSRISPMRWGIENYLNLFIRESDLAGILPNTILLVLFFGLAMTASLRIFAHRT